jgi:hypothetical protein
MIKRTGALLLTLLYAVTTSGIVVNMHYCGHLLVSVRVNSPSKRCLGESMMKNCTDKQFKVKVKDAHQSTSFSFSPKTFVFETPSALFANYSFTQQHYLADKLLGRAPPDLPADNVRVFIKNRTFRI